MRHSINQKSGLNNLTVFVINKIGIFIVESFCIALNKIWIWLEKSEIRTSSNRNNTMKTEDETFRQSKINNYKEINEPHKNWKLKDSNYKLSKISGNRHALLRYRIIHVIIAQNRKKERYLYIQTGQVCALVDGHNWSL